MALRAGEDENAIGSEPGSKLTQQGRLVFGWKVFDQLDAGH
jgi:hypothetical protein